MDRYKHSETGWMIIATMSGTFILSVIALALSCNSGLNPGLWFFPPFLLAILANLYKMTVSVGDSSVKAAMGPGLFKMEFNFSDIASAGAVRNSWLKGWGIRYLGDGWLFNVNSLEAVELKMKNGRRYQLGTDEPLALLTAILSAGVPAAGGGINP